MKKSKFEELDKDGRIWWGESGNSMPRLKRFLSEVKEGVVPQTLWKFDEVGHTQESKKELMEFVGFQNTDNVIDSVKPTRLIRKMIKIGTQPDSEDIVLDFFLGTGTTGHAVLAQNADDNGKRRFIGVQLPEPLIVPEMHLATIADVARTRIARFIAKLDAEQSGKLALGRTAKADRGFKVFKLARSNFRVWNAAQIPHGDTEVLEKQLDLHVEHIVEGRTETDLLYEILLKSGFSLTTPVEKLVLMSKTIHTIADGAMLICLERELTHEVIKAMASREPGVTSFRTV